MNYPGAWITPVTLFPTGIAFEVLAEFAHPERGQIIPYFVSAKLRVDGDVYEIGAGTSASSSTARISFWFPADAIEGGMNRVRKGPIAIDIYEGNDRRTATTERTLVQTVNVIAAQDR